jgi:hypothetical protein
MENGKRIMENEELESIRAGLSNVYYPLSVSVAACSACGASSHRGTAKFCLTCGKLLEEDYQPLDTLRSSYRLQGKSFPIENSSKTEESSNLFERNDNSAAQTAWACVVYSFVPYLGILFVPLAFLVSGFGFVVSYRRPESGGRRLALACLALSFFILAVQIFLWWLLYIIPELGRNI